LLGEAQRQQMESRVQQQQEREDGQQQPRGDEGGYESERQPRDEGFERDRRPQQPQARPMPVASGLTTIDTDEPDYGGPIETPEGRRAPVDEPARVEQMASPRPEPQPQPVAETVNGGTAPAAEAASAEASAKRSRPRRRPKAEAQVEAPPQAE
jgi:hypothetical protein